LQAQLPVEMVYRISQKRLISFYKQLNVNNLHDSIFQIIILEKKMHDILIRYFNKIK